MSSTSKSRWTSVWTAYLPSVSFDELVEHATEGSKTLVKTSLYFAGEGTKAAFTSLNEAKRRAEIVATNTVRDPSSLTARSFRELSKQDSVIGNLAGRVVQECDWEERQTECQNMVPDTEEWERRKRLCSAMSDGTVSPEQRVEMETLLSAEGSQVLKDLENGPRTMTKCRTRLEANGVPVGSSASRNACGACQQFFSNMDRIIRDESDVWEGLEGDHGTEEKGPHSRNFNVTQATFEEDILMPGQESSHGDSCQRRDKTEGTPAQIVSFIGQTEVRQKSATDRSCYDFSLTLKPLTKMHDADADSLRQFYQMLNSAQGISSRWRPKSGGGRSNVLVLPKKIGSGDDGNGKWMDDLRCYAEGRSAVPDSREGSM
ncbi:hypothetical protein BD324DRAFT_650124 [Kockovaella imperatae]|uniref:Uncharacterized protein n=1 Tax=Kockovaella imperatae TaxID=4999 RepID=A0A1Y1UHT4_9TREE|nr:hypothetical protein BD324DRAFT_650124 [Kockovaella imperatae]ORX37549.1 hypothetical protein BD324DRAFT_650124 [Kockovaella imperatae]